jgi:alkanesulfonate monooxygenase SsuD/methylene tetrahydromethanopterin reductase-like flavin-dependent oxidoreductase (luciferase family)
VLKLGLYLGYWTSATVVADELDLVREAEALGFDSVWVAEAYGSDAATVLAWLAAGTERIKLGAGIFQIPARSPAMTAMTAATLDVLSGGRLLLGLGSSGPQVAEGWHGQAFARQLQRTREYIEIVRMALTGQRVQYAGEIYTLPLPGGPGKPLKLMIAPVQERVPIYLAANGPRNVALAGELAESVPGDVEVAPVVPVSVGADLEVARDAVRPYVALYTGGMGSRERNFYNDLMRRAGYESEARRVQELYLSGRKAEAEAALPVQYVDEVALCGSASRITEGLARYREAGATTLLAIPIGTSLGQRFESVRGLAAAASELAEVSAT